MHIGVLTHNYPRFAGDFSGTFVEALCNELVIQGERVTVWAPYDTAYNRRLDAPAQLSLYRYAWPARLHRLGYMRTMQADLALRLEAYLLSPALFAAGIRHVLQAARRDRPDVLHAHWLLPNGFMAAVVSRHLGIPLVVSVPGSDAQVAGQNPLFRAMARFTFRQAGLLTANSEALQASVTALGAAPEKFDMIVYGVDPDELKPDPTGDVTGDATTGDAAEASATLRHELAIAAGETVVLCVGRMVPKKGFDLLIRAMAEGALQHYPITAVMIGEGDDKAAWQQLAQALGVAQRLRWIGTVPKDRIGRYYKMADLLAMPSVSRPADGLNVCVLDAMSCGKPVVASEAAGNRLAVVHEQTGLIVPEQDAAQLAGAIARLARDPALRRQMGAAGRRRIEQELGWPQLARRYLRHFRRLQQPQHAISPTAPVA